METLPAELLVAGLMSRLDAHSLGRLCCTSRTIHSIGATDEAWRPLLLRQGVTQLGMSLWQADGGPSLLQLCQCRLRM